MEWNEIIAGLIRPLTYLFDGAQRIYLPYLILSFLPVAIAGWWANRQDWNFKTISDFCFPPEIWKHDSSKLDRRFFVVNTAMMGLLIVPFFAGSTLVSDIMESGLHTLIGEPQKLTESSYLIIAAITVGFFLLTDFAVFLAHYLQHKVPFLWEFHKVHHSAEVMTPITVYRMHPVDDILSYTLGGIMAGGMVGSVNYLFLENPGFLQMFGLNIFTFIFYVGFYNLRHSHFWLSFGFLNHAVVSPAMHQLHHSSAQKHWDKNMGFVLSIWDRAFGTLYLPKEKEELTLGIGAETHEYDTLANLYLLPFEKNAARVKQKLLEFFSIEPASK